MIEKPDLLLVLLLCGLESVLYDDDEVGVDDRDIAGWMTGPRAAAAAARMVEWRKGPKEQYGDTQLTHLCEQHSRTIRIPPLLLLEVPPLFS